MEALKALFGDKALTFDELQAKLKENEETIKLANLKDGEYVSRLKSEDEKKEAEKKLTEVTKQLEEAKKVTNPNAELQKQIETLTAEKTDLETKQADATKQLNTLSKRQLASTKTGITNTDFLDLMILRHGDKDDEEFSKEVTKYAEDNKQMWQPTGGSPDLNGNPQNKDEADYQAMRKVAGLK
jgi:chromosome segregation ATPase